LKANIQLSTRMQAGQKKKKNTPATLSRGASRAARVSHRRPSLSLRSAAPPPERAAGARGEGGGMAFPLLPGGSRRAQRPGPPRRLVARGSPPATAVAVATGSSVVPAGSGGSQWGCEVVCGRRRSEQGDNGSCHGWRGLHRRPRRPARVNDNDGGVQGRRLWSAQLRRQWLRPGATCFACSRPWRPGNGGAGGVCTRAMGVWQGGVALLLLCVILVRHHFDGGAGS
jgi:hypothetical protein